MPIDINALRAEKGGNPDLWREMTTKRFRPVALVDKVIDLDEVRGAAGVGAAWRGATGGRRELACSAGDAPRI